MKRLAFAVALLVVTGAAHAFDASRARPTIGVLQPREMTTIARAFHDELHSELRERGFEVFEVHATFEDLSLDPARDADWYVEVIPEQGETVDYGGIGVGGRHADVTLGLLVSRIAADANVYRGRTLELIATESLKKKNTALVPTSVGFGGRSLFAAIALPFVERAQAKSVARAVARDLAERVANAVRE